MSDSYKNNTGNPWHVLRQALPEARAALGLSEDAELTQWQTALDLKLLPRLDQWFPLVAAVCGGGSAGKSTLFNSLINTPLSPTGGRAGLNRRVLAAFAEDHLVHPRFIASLNQVFDNRMTPMKNPDQLTTPGDPLYWSGKGVPTNVVLLDTPDIDTGARGEYHNREQARLSLESADLFIYIFTNATYNNRDNTDFIARMLTGMGTRPCFLVYRVYASYAVDEIADHATTVARNIYGSDYEKHVLGIFRADEDNAVAAEQKLMQVHSLKAGAGSLQKALSGLDPVDLRRDVIRSMSQQALKQADRLLAFLKNEHRRLDDYLDALQATQVESVQRALSHFPTDRVLGRFAKIWMATDPRHIKVMRRTGQVMEWPIKTLTRLVKLGLSDDKKTPADSNEASSAKLDVDLLNAATFLYQQAAADKLTPDSGNAVQAPAAVFGAQEGLRNKDWKTSLTHIQEQREMILSWSGSLESDLKTLANELRTGMGVWDRMRQTFAALLNVLPATAAVTYVLSTGDPVGATGIKIKLTGLLGLKDLYALIAIPATAGLKKADQKQLALLLEPVARTWLEHKFTQVQALFEEQITGDLIADGHRAQTKARDLLTQAQQALDRVKENVA